jgi:hypothetical protein
MRLRSSCLVAPSIFARGKLSLVANFTTGKHRINWNVEPKSLASLARPSGVLANVGGGPRPLLFPAARSSPQSLALLATSSNSGLCGNSRRKLCFLLKLRMSPRHIRRNTFFPSFLRHHSAFVFSSPPCLLYCLLFFRTMTPCLIKHPPKETS